MITSVVASQARGKKAQDVIFAANALAVEAAKIHGKENVVNATIGAILDEEENLVVLKTVEDVYRKLPAVEYAAYAPIAGLPEFIETAIAECFGDYKPEGYIKAVATAGGTGVIHHLIQNYTELGDEVLTSDWFWGAYSSLCDDNGRKLVTYSIFDDQLHFNHESFRQRVQDLAEKQSNLLIIINSPAHNPTGYSLTDDDWNNVLSYLKKVATEQDKRIIINVDVAYLDYSGTKQESRNFFRHFSNLPPEILVVVGYSLSKSYTMYGQRVGAMIGISASEEVVQEFFDVNQYTSRATWSNICRPAMKTMAIIAADKEKQQAYEEERNFYYELTQKRAEIFMEEAKACGLPVLPYKAGFFISIPSADSNAVCNALHKDNVFMVPLKRGVRMAVCAIPTHKMKGLAQKVYEAMKSVGEL